MSSPVAHRHFAFFLHGHLPWVLPHGRWPHGAEWLCEATVETYLPLLRVGRSLRDRGLRGGITLGISPVLAEQLSHPDFVDLFREYLDDRVRTASAEAEQFKDEGSDDLAALAARWGRFYVETQKFFFDELDADILGGFRELEEAGVLEIASCGATHGYLPLLGRDESIALQVELARRVHRRHFGRAPRGMWIPEAAYRPEGPWSFPGSPEASRERPGVETFLAAGGIRYFLVDASLLVGGRSVGSYPDVFRDHAGFRDEARRESPPVPAPDRPRDPRHSYWVAAGAGSEPAVRFFVRDPETALQVWSGEHGYPGDPARTGGRFRTQPVPGGR